MNPSPDFPLSAPIKGAEKLATVPKFDLSLHQARGVISEFLKDLSSLVAKASPAELTETFIHLKAWEEALEDIGSVARGMLLKILETGGTVTTDKGSMSMQIGEYRIQARPWRTGFDPKKVEALIRAKGKIPGDFLDQEIKYVVSLVRLENAVTMKELTRDELETCKYPLSWALQAPKKVNTDERE